MYKRLQNLNVKGRDSCFLWGPRQTGKSTLLKQLFPDSPTYDLLLSDQYQRLSRRPALLREEILANPTKKPVIIDEIQTIPALLNEVQWLIVNHKIQFILCGSSARKIKRSGANLLGGRAIRFELFPLVSKEIGKFNLLEALNKGLLPRHYGAPNPTQRLEAYVGDYLKEEIASEALSHNIPTFGRFLESAAFSNGEIINYQNIATECGVSPPTAKNYFQILTDTLIGRLLPAFQKKPKRRVITAPKFYFFDVGLVNFLLKRGQIKQGSELFGRAFEQFIFQELVAHRHYSNLNYDIHTWRTASQFEVDFILGQGEVALEVKGTEVVHPRHLRGLHAFGEDYNPKKRIVVSMDVRPRKLNNVLILPWSVFLDKLWAGEILS